MKRQWRIVLWVLGILVVLMLVAPLLVRVLFPEPKLRAMLLPRAAAAMGRSVDAAQLRATLGWRGFGVEVQRLSLGADSTGLGLGALTVPRVRAYLALGPLLGKKVVLKSLRIDEPEITIVLPPAGAAGQAPGGAGKALLPAGLAIAAPDVRLSRAIVHLRQAGGLVLDATLPEARFGGQLGKDGRGRLQADLRADPLHLEQGDTLAVDAQARLQLAADLADERLRFSRLDMEISALALASRPPRAAEPLRLSGDKLELAGSGGLALAGLLTGKPLPSDLALSVTLKSGELRLEAPGRRPGTSTTVVAPSAEGGARLSSASMEQLAIDSLTLRAPSLAMTLGTGAGAPPFTVQIAGATVTGTARAPLKKTPEAPPMQAALRAVLESLSADPVLAEGGRASLRLERAEIPLAVTGQLVDAPDIALVGGAFELRQPKAPVLKGGIPQARLHGRLEGFALGLEGQAQIMPLTAQQGDTLDLSAAADLDFAFVAEPEQLRLGRCELKVRDIDARAGAVPGQSVRTADAAATLTASGDLPLAALQAKPLDPAALPLDLSLRGSGITVTGEALAQPIVVETIRVGGRLAALAIETIQIKSGRSRAELSGRLAGLKPPRFDLNLKSPLIDVTELLPAAGAQPAADKGGAKPAAMLPPVIVPGQLAFQIDRLLLAQAELQGLRGKAVTDAGGVRISDLQAGLFGGRLAGDFALAAADKAQARCTGKLQVSSVQAAAFLAAFTPVKRGIAGALSTTFDFATLLAPGAPPRDLNLDASVDLRDGALTGLSLLRTLASVTGLPAKEQYALMPLTQTVQVRGDRVTTPNLRLRFEDQEILADGSAGLLDGSLDYRGTLKLGKNALSRLGANSPLRLLAGGRGELSLGFRLAGTLKDPSITLDQAAIEEQVREEAAKKVEEEKDKLIDQGLDALKKRLGR